MVFDVFSQGRDFIGAISESAATATVFIALLLLSSVPVGAAVDTIHHWLCDMIYLRESYFTHFVKPLVESRERISGRQIVRWNYSEIIDDKKLSEVGRYVMVNPNMVWHLYEQGDYLEEFFVNTSIALFLLAIVGFALLQSYAYRLLMIDSTVVFGASALLAALLFLAGGIVYYETICTRLVLHDALKNLGVFEKKGPEKSPEKEQVRVEEELKVRVKNTKGKEILESRVVGDVEKCVSRKPEGAVQIVWKRNELGSHFIHIHCKICDNEWKIEESKDLSEKFEVQEILPTLWHIKCRKCGIGFESG